MTTDQYAERVEAIAAKYVTSAVTRMDLAIDMLKLLAEFMAEEKRATIDSIVIAFKAEEVAR